MSRKALAVQPFRMGVEYAPRPSGPGSLRVDGSEVARDFARMRELGFDLVRIPLAWEAFTPEPFATDPEMLRRFDDVQGLAREAGLRTIPVLFSAHANGTNRLPRWALDRRAPAGPYRTISGDTEMPYGAGDLYGGELLEAQRWFARRLALRARDDDSVFAWSLGDSIASVREPARARDAAHWSAAIGHDLYDASNRPSTAGISGEDLTRDRTLRLSSVAEPWAFVSLRADAAASSLARDGTDVDAVAFLGELASAFSHRPVLFVGLGDPSETSGDRVPDDDESAAHATATVERLHASGAFGAIWGRWADAGDARPGIVRADGSPRPIARALSRIARETRDVVVPRARRPHDEASHYRGLPASLRDAYARYLAVNNDAAGEVTG